jgi:hypothetical protein
VISNRHQVDASHHLEQLAVDMGSAAVAGCRHIDFARIGLGVGNELGDRFGGNRRVDHHDVGRAHNASDRRDSFMKVKSRLP